MNSSQYSYFSTSGSKQGSNLITKSRPNSISRKPIDDDFTPVFEEEDGWTSVDNATKPRISGEYTKDTFWTSSQSSSNTPVAGIPSSSQILPFPRPYSVPHNNSSPGTFTLSTQALKLSTKTAPQNTDRMSSASLPLPTQIPYYSLPKVGTAVPEDSSERDGTATTRASDHVSELSKSTMPEMDDSSPIEPGPYSPRPTPTKADSSDSSHSSGSLASVSSNGQARESDASPLTAAEEAPSDPSSSQDAVPPPPSPSLLEHSHNRNSHPVNPVQSSWRDSAAIQRANRYIATTNSTYGAATALRTSMPAVIASSVPPPEPPTVLPVPSPMSTPLIRDQGSSSSSTCSTCASLETGATSPSSSLHTCNSQDSSVSRSLSYPPQMSRNPLGSSSRPATSEPPYAPFLSHAPPPADSWIEVETTPTEYRLNVKLPGFKRDGM